ncbi:MAG: hypothetical protein NTU64_14745 [Hyphomicrobiales bacterium]|nr:hypothetical protein [Hyphomicrobiales bacterium]
MTLPIIPDGFCAALRKKLADRLEAVVGNAAQVFANIDATSPRIFVKCEKFKFE